MRETQWNRGIIFNGTSHKDFCEKYMAKCKRSDCWHRALIYTLGLTELINQKAAVIAYNAAYERGILQIYGVELDVAFIDPMLMFARVYGDYSEYFGDYRWQKLSTAAHYYGFEYKAHDALEDVRATQYVFDKMIEAGEPAIMI